MTTNHIDQLAEWYADAERITVTNLPRIGDTLIFPYNAGGYAIEVEEDEWTPNIVIPGEVVRILTRAPKPKPAWHDAVAVIAHTARFSERRPFALTHTEDVLDPYNTEWITRDDLLDPVPLIEAKVTDEARDRVWEELVHHGLIDPDKHRPSQGWTADVVHVALGLEAE